MKRYIFSLAAMVIAICAVSFTTISNTSLKPSATSVFYYYPPGGTDFSSSAVQNVSNWSTTTATGCGNGSNKACKFTIDNMYTSGTGSSRVITIALNAEPGNGGASSGYVIRTGLNPHVSLPAEKL